MEPMITPPPTPPTPPSTMTAKFYIKCAIVLCIITVVAVMALSIAVPNNTGAIATILGLTTPIIMALVAAGLHATVTTFDGKMTQLLNTTAQKEHLAGLVEGLKENPNTNIK